MAATCAAEQSSAMPITEPLRRFNLTSEKSRRGSSWRDRNNASSDGSSATAESSCGSNRPSISGAGRRRSSLASFSSRLRKPKKSAPTVSEEDGPILSQNSTLGERFLGLPAEIQTTILASLSIPDLLSIRLVSRSFLAIFQVNSSTITRNALQTSAEDEAESQADVLLHLYPPTFSSTSTDAYFLRTLRRRSLAARQLRVLLTFVQTRVYILKLTRDMECGHFAPYRPGLYYRLYLPIIYIQHFLETNRYLMMRSHPSHSAAHLTIEACPTCLSSLKSVIASYPSEVVVPIYQVIQLLLQHFRTATRVPSPISTFERRLRGWGYGPPPQEHMAQLVFLGGIQELCKVDEMQGNYSKRINIVKSYTDNLSEAVRVNSVAFPDIYETRTDPVMHNSKIKRPVMATQIRENLRTMIEAQADEQTITKSLNVDLNLLTKSILESTPSLDTFLTGPDSLLGKYIMEKKLIKHERELFNPYGFVKKLMVESYSHVEGMARRRETGASTGNSAHDQDDAGAGPVD